MGKTTRVSVTLANRSQITSFLVLAEEIPGNRSVRNCEELISNSKDIVREGWVPAFWMIDKSANEISAIREGKALHFTTTA